MENQFLDLINRQQLFKKSDKILVAVSGGVDSVVLLHLLNKTGYKLAIAHCNFQLRGAESDADEMFVSALANKYGCKIFIERFDTNKHAKGNGLSIQMAARELRYSFFEEVRSKNKFNHIVTAHHATDNVETILINILRGAGVKSLKGIPARNKNIVRPLLNFTKDEIKNYCDFEKLKWREDSSNTSDDYVRNKLRNKVLPVLKEINSSLEQAFLKHSEILAGVSEVYFKYVNDISGFIFKKSKYGTVVNSERLKQMKLHETIWFELFKQFDFSADTVRKLYATKLKPGKFFLSNAYCLHVNRKDWLITDMKSRPAVDITIKQAGKFSFGNFSLIIKKMSTDKITLQKIKSNKNRNISFFTADDLKFPITIRTFKNGDFFYPIGMKGKKLLSDYFTDKKFSSLQKEKQLLLLCGKQIAWVMGERISEKFKVTTQSTSIYKFELKSHE